MDHKRERLAETIKAAALELGFHRAGITSADPVQEAGRRFIAWLSDGFSADMAYLQKSPEIRSDPRIRFPEAQSVVCLALSYYQEPPSTPAPSGPAGKVARYAWGEDYHTVIEEKLERLIDTITGLGGRCWKGYVDHGPLLERAFAERAGVGFIGKNTNLITPEHGSWVFLAEVVTDLVLAADPPMTSQCGACRICIQACPTGALTDAYRLDANRCLSYLTIENKQEIPEEFFPEMAGWIFGCDICQEVCPYNLDPAATDETRFSPEKGAGPMLPIETLLTTPPSELKKKYASSPLLRAKPRGLIRNALAIRKWGEQQR